MRKRIILVGKGASGKDHLSSELRKLGYPSNVSYTTRPPRNGEKEGEHYHFVERPFFESLLSSNLLYEHAEFNEWYYGTTVAAWNTFKVFIMTPRGISQIRPEDRKDCCIVYLDIEESVRKGRLMERSDADSVDRRIDADKIDFKKFTDFDIRIVDAIFNVEDILDQCKKMK